MALSPRDVLALNRAQAMKLVHRNGLDRTRKHLTNAEAELMRRVREAVKGPGAGSFTEEQAKATLAQVRQVLRELNGGIKETLVGGAKVASEKAADGVVEYLKQADRQFRGVGTQPLALDESAMFDVAQEGARSTILRRLASSGTEAPGAEGAEHKAKQGILDRYGMNVVGQFEEVLMGGVATRASFDTMKERLVSKSLFLQGAPASWAERIVRTELMGAYNRAGWEANREADEQLGDMVKILSATFDERTAADSYAVHGQIRRTEQAFDTWYGPMQHPPARPNDREIVVPHRISWEIPKYLQWRPHSQVVARWTAEKRKGAPPGPLEMTTVPLGEFGNPQPRRRRRGEEERTGEGED